MQEHGGRIRLESRPGAGASFYVELPVTGGEAAGVGAARAAVAGPIEAVAGASILVVEDEAALASAVVDALRDAGYVVEHAADGEEALAKVNDAAFDLVICDLKMPRLDGQAFYRTLSAAAPALAQARHLRDRRRRRHRRRAVPRGERLPLAGEAVQARRSAAGRARRTR